MREELTKMEAPLSANSTICALITKEGTLKLSICKGEAIKSGTQIRQKKVRVLLTEEEIRLITHLVFYIEPFIQWRKQNVGFSTQILASETSIDIETSNW